ncbi:hypothetical protein MMC25_001030 [Agyrium rufum]|nr:hypothetical protein [Agyrium rufum]
MDIGTATAAFASYSPVTLSGQVTSYLPLESTWPFSAGCSSQLLANDPGASVNFLFFGDPKYPNVVPGQPTCLPPQISPWWYQTPTSGVTPTTTLLGGYEFLCPEAYETVYRYTDTVTGSATTTIGCCPSSFTYVSTLYDYGQPYQCYSIAAPQIITYAQNFSTGAVVEYTITSTSLPSSSVILGVQINGYIFPGPTTTTSSSLTTSKTVGSGGSVTSTTSASISVSTSTNSDPASASTSTIAVSTRVSNTGLSTGAKAGIGVGVGLGIIAIIAILAAAFLYRRKRRARSSAAELEARTGKRNDSRPTAEMDSRVRKHEMDNSGQRHEMPAAGAYQYVPELASAKDERAATTVH